MQLKFNTTTWQKKKYNHHLMVTYIAGRFGWRIEFNIAKVDKILLHLTIKSKKDLVTFMDLLHTAGQMMSVHKEEISHIDRNVFADKITKLNPNITNNLRDDHFVDSTAAMVHKYGRDLWELLGKSNLMFLLSSNMSDLD